MNATPRLSMKIIDDPGAIAALRASWSALDARPGVHPFQQFGWASTWLDTIGVGGGWRPLIATAWDDDRLAALLPLCVRRYKGVRILEWIGARVSDYCDALVAPDMDAPAVLAALWKAVERHGGFDVARFNHVRDDAHVSPVLSALSPWTETHEHAGGVPITWASGEEWLRAQSAGMRDRVKYNGRRMAKAGYDVEVCGTDDACAAIVDTLVAQKRPWLAARGLSSMINEPGGVQFLQGVVAAAAARGELHLSTVRNQERIAACDLAFVRNGNVYSYIASFDPELAKYSFGRVLTDRLLMWACDTGQRRLDLLLGAYDYKTEYNCTLEPVRTEVLARGLLGAAAVMVYRRKSASRAQ